MFEMLKFGDAKQEFLDVLPNQRKRNVDEVNEDIDDYYNKFYLNLVNSTNRSKVCDATVISPSGSVSERNSGKVRDLEDIRVMVNFQPK